jgi:hypothetical protein
MSIGVIIGVAECTSRNRKTWQSQKGPIEKSIVYERYGQSTDAIPAVSRVGSALPNILREVESNWARQDLVETFLRNKNVQLLFDFSTENRGGLILILRVENRYFRINDQVSTMIAILLHHGDSNARRFAKTLLGSYVVKFASDENEQMKYLADHLVQEDLQILDKLSEVAARERPNAYIDMFLERIQNEIQVDPKR